MKRKNISKSIATCLTLAMVLGSIPNSESVSKAATEATATPSPTPAPTSSPTPTAVPDYSEYKPGTTTLAARAGSSRVRLNWTKVADASGYYIYTRTATEASYKKIKTVVGGSTTEYTKTSLINGTTYYYRIAAYRTVNGVEVEGGLSSAVSATPVSVSATSKTAKKYSTKAKFTASPAYKTYKKTKAALNYTKSFAIPGMKTTNVGGFGCTTMVPQGMCLAGSYFLITAYDYKNTDYSVVYVVSRSSKSYITTIVLPSKAKVGGIAYDGTNVWVSKGKAVASFPYSVITNAVNAGTSYTNLSAYRSVYNLSSTASYMGYYNGVLWIGTFSQSSSTMTGYNITNKETLPSLVPTNTMAVPSKTQGITFDSDGTMILTRSYRTKKAKSGYISQMRTYKPSYNATSSTGKILKNAALKVTTLPPMAEGVAIYGTYTYTLFSSSYYKSCKYPVDRVLALKTNKLI